MNFSLANYNMSLALDNASKAFSANEVPVGAVITDSYGQVLAQTYNTKEMDTNAVHHAEILAIEKASQALGSWRLNDCTLYVTLEPCVMCMGALVQARIGKLVFGAYDQKGGAISLGFNMHHHSSLNHRFPVYGGFKHRECSKILSEFFRRKRKTYSKV